MPRCPNTSEGYVVTELYIKITPALVRLTSKQDYPWKEKNKPEFLEKNQRPKDKMQTESLMGHSCINGNLTKAVFYVPSFCLPVTHSRLAPRDTANAFTKKGWGRDVISQESHYI